MCSRNHHRNHRNHRNSLRTTGPRSRCNKLCTNDIQPGYGSTAELPTKKEWMEILEDAGNATVKADLCKYVASNPEWFFGHKLGAVKDATVALA